MKTKRKHIAQHIEIKFDQPEPFRLTIEQTQDGERIQSEIAKRQHDKQTAEQQQTRFI